MKRSKKFNQYALELITYIKFKLEQSANALV